MFISVQFKDKAKNFRGRTYDYELAKDEDAPAVGSIIRMMDEDYNYICYGTRVKVTEVKRKSETARIKIRYLTTTLDD